MKRKSPGQIAYESFRDSLQTKGETFVWENVPIQKHWEAAAAAVLADQWRPVTEPPEDINQHVLLAYNQTEQGVYRGQFWLKSLHTQLWMPIPPLPQPPVDEFADLKKAFESGATIQINTSTDQSPVWHDTPNPKWIAGEKYRVKPDEYAELKSAHAAGKVIQIQWTFDKGTDLWCEGVTPDWSLPANQYRVKPWTLSRHIPGFRPLEDGEEWHRQDFTEDMLPEGYRPLLLGERWIVGDQIIRRSTKWETAGDCKDDLLNVKSLKATNHSRTTRPLPPTKAELETKAFETWWNEYKLGCVDITPNRRTAYAAWQAARNQ